MQTGAAHARRQILRMIASGVAVFASAKAFAVDKLAKSNVDYKTARKAGSAVITARCSCPRTAASRFRAKSARVGGAISGGK